MHATPRRTVPRGFTLVELLVVIAIIGLISAVAIPVVLPALNERRVSEAARLLQAVLSGTRDAAIRANAPRGIRLLVDPGFPFVAGQPLASNRFVAIEPAPNYDEGAVQAPQIYFPGTSPGIVDPTYNTNYLRVAEVGPYPYVSNLGTILNSPTGWKFNIRQGDKIRFNNSGVFYTVAGPINGLPVTSNPERYICYNPTETSPVPNASLNKWLPEYLNLTNGIDDNGNGWIDESCDGIDNDGDGVIDPGFNGIDDDGKNGIDDPAELYYSPIASHIGAEYELEVFVGTQANTLLQNANYTISRRPVISPNTAETTLPTGTVIDLTTWNASIATPPVVAPNVPIPLLPERSRLPVDPFSGIVDILIDQTGRVVPPGAGSGGGGYYANTPIASLPFYHFWITEREGVMAPLWDTQPLSNPYVPVINPNYGTTATSQNYLLPMPQSTNNPTVLSSGLAPANYYEPMPSPYAGSPIYLKGERRLVTLFTKSGQIVSNSIETFNVNDTSYPYYDAQSGIKESQ